MTTKEKILALHKPDAWKKSMVWSVWEDGEITLEQGGELFGKRNLHQIHPPLHPFRVPMDYMPIQDPSTGHGRVFCDTKEECEQVQKIIKGKIHSISLIY